MYIKIVSVYIPAFNCVHYVPRIVNNCLFIEIINIIYLCMEAQMKLIEMIDWD